MTAASSAQPKVPKNAAKAIIRTDSPAPSASVAADSTTHDDGTLENFEHPIFKELQKNIRNINKKISNAAKAESLVAENPDKTLDELVSARIINKDQKEQVLKLPNQRNQLAQYEEQVATAKKLVADYRERALAAKYKLKEELLGESYKAKEEAVRDAETKFADEKRVAVHDTLLAVAQFLCLAAARRAEEADQNLDENKALEGVLLQVYSGDEAAVSTMLKLVNASEETTVSTSGESLETTYAQVKAAAEAYRSPSEIVEEEAEPEPEPEPVEAEIAAAPVATEAPTEEFAPTEAATEIPAPAVEETVDSVEETSASQDWVKVNPEDAQPSPVAEKVELVVETIQELPEAGPIGAPEVPLVETEVTPSKPAVQAPKAKQGPKPNGHEKKAWATEPTNGGVPAELVDGFHQVQRKNHGQRTDSFRGGRGRGGEWRGRGSYRGVNNGGRGGRGNFSRGGSRGGALPQSGRSAAALRQE